MEKPLRLLLIEDNEDDAHFILRMLENNGYNVDCNMVKSANEVLKAIKKEYDVIISDYQLPGFDGGKALQIIRENGIDTPFIIVSGKIGEDVAVSLVHSGAHDYIMKDNLKRLIPAVERGIQDAEMRKMARKSEDRLQTMSLIVKMTNHSIMISDADGKLEWVNDGFIKMTGYTLEEVIGKKPGDFLLGPETNQETVKRNSELIRNRQPVNCEILNYAKSGRKFWIELHIHPIFNSQGDVTKFFSFQIDITERKLLHEREHKLNEELEKKVKERTLELEAMNRDLERFNSTLSHDLRSPLRQNKMLLDIMNRKLSKQLDESDTENITILRNNILRMEMLVNGLLELSKLGKKELELSEVDTKALVDGILSEIKNDYPDERYELKSDELPEMVADPMLVQQVFQNLLSNAYKYSSKKDKPKIKIGYKDNGSEHLFMVSDNGAGFDMKYYDNLFASFNRLHANTEFEGVGLGLSNSKRFVEKLGGKIWAESKPNVGSTFYFTVPKAK
ncbi:MAG: ATP-binding protein [Chitinophagales bacterium]